MRAPQLLATSHSPALSTFRLARAISKLSVAGYLHKAATAFVPPPVLARPLDSPSDQQLAHRTTASTQANTLDRQPARSISTSAPACHLASDSFNNSPPHSPTPRTPQPTPPPHTHKAHRLRNNRQHARPKTLATPSLPRPAAESAPPSPSQARVRVTDRDQHPTLEPTSYSLVPSPLVRPRQPPTVDGDGRPSITLRCRREAAAPQPARHIVSACSAPLRSYTPLSPLCATPPSIPPWSSSNSSLRGLLRHHLAPIRSVPSAIDTLGDEHQASLSDFLFDETAGPRPSAVRHVPLPPRIDIPTF